MVFEPPKLVGDPWFHVLGVVLQKFKGLFVMGRTLEHEEPLTSFCEPSRALLYLFSPNK